MAQEVDWQAIRKRARVLYNALRESEDCHSSFTATKALEQAATEFEVGHGVEGFCDQSSGEHGVTYINVGDPYLTTVLFESDSERFSVGCYGNIIEAHEDWYQ